MKVYLSLIAAQTCPLENSLSISHNASKSCRNFTAVHLSHKQFYSIDPRVLPVAVVRLHIGDLYAFVWAGGEDPRGYVTPVKAIRAGEVGYKIILFFRL